MTNSYTQNPDFHRFCAIPLTLILINRRMRVMLRCELRIVIKKSVSIRQFNCAAFLQRQEYTEVWKFEVLLIPCLSLSYLLFSRTRQHDTNFKFWLPCINLSVDLTLYTLYTQWMWVNDFVRHPFNQYSLQSGIVKLVAINLFAL